MVCPVDMIPTWSARENEKVANRSCGGAVSLDFLQPQDEGRKEERKGRKEKT